MKTSKMKKCIITFSFALLVSFIGFNVYQKVVNTPKKIFIDAINSLSTDYKYFDNIQNINYSFPYNNFTYDGVIDINIVSSLLESLKVDNDYQDILKIIDYLNQLQFNYKLQKNDQELLLDINSVYKDKNLSFTYYVNNLDHYIKLNNYDETYIKINELVEKIKNNFIYIEDTNYLFDFIKNSFIKNLSDDYFKTKKEEINLNGKKISVNKNILTLDYQNMNTILSAIVSDLKNDDKASGMLTNIIPNLDNFNIEIIDDRDAVIYFNTYTDNNKLIKYELEVDNIDYLNLGFNNLTISFPKNSNIIEIMVDNNKFVSLHLNEKENGCNIEFYLNDSKLLTLDVSNEETTKQLLINFGFLANNNFNIILSEVLDKNILEDYDRIEDQLLFDFNILGFNILKLEMTNKSQIYDNSYIKMDIFETKNINELSNDDLEKLKEIFKDFITLSES